MKINVITKTEPQLAHIGKNIAVENYKVTNGMKQEVSWYSEVEVLDYSNAYDMLTAMGLSPHPSNMDEIKTGIYTRFE